MPRSLLALAPVLGFTLACTGLLGEDTAADTGGAAPAPASGSGTRMGMGSAIPTTRRPRASSRAATSPTTRIVTTKTRARTPTARRSATVSTPTRTATAWPTRKIRV
jgi:hypothetical protein